MTRQEFSVGVLHGWHGIVLGLLGSIVFLISGWQDGAGNRHDQFCILVFSSSALDTRSHMAGHWSQNLGRSFAGPDVFLFGVLVNQPLAAAIARPAQAPRVL